MRGKMATESRLRAKGIRPIFLAIIGTGIFLFAKAGALPNNYNSLRDDELLVYLDFDDAHPSNLRWALYCESQSTNCLESFDA